MKSKNGKSPNNHRRLPKKGCIFLLSRIAGWLFIIAGVLLILIAVIGFFFIMIKGGSTLLESLRYLGQQKMAGLIFASLLVDLLAFRFLGLVGIVIAITGWSFTNHPMPA